MRLAALAILLLSRSLIQAQTQPFNCVAGAASTPTLRPGAQADFVGAYTLSCAGLRPAGGVTGSIRITLNTIVTSRLLSAVNNASEALLLLGQPQPGSQVGQVAGSAPVPDANAIQGRQTGAATIEFENVTILPPGPAEPVERIMHLANVRVNATPLGASAQVFMTASITAVPGVLVTNPVQVVATTAPAGLLFAPRTTDDTAPYSGQLNGCIGNKPVVGAATAPDFNVRFTESLVGQFRERNVATTPGNPTALGNQNDPTGDYGTETGFYNSAFPATGGMSQAGLATQGTRLMVRFSGIPVGVRVWVTVLPVQPGTSPTGAAAALVLTDANGAGLYNPAFPSIGPYAEIPVSSGSAVAVWEMLDSSRAALESLSFGVVLSVPTNSAGGGQVTVTGFQAPLAAVPSSLTAPAPNFAAAAGAQAAAVITGCLPAPAILTSCPLTSGSVGAGYAQSLAATGGIPPYAWSLAGGGLPAGLTLSASGNVSGTLIAQGTFVFVLRVTDAAGASATRDCSMQVFGAMTITTVCPLPDGLAGAVYAQALLVTGGVGPYTFSIASGALPPGMFIVGGTLSGLPSQPGTFQFVLQAGDSRGATVLKPCSMRILGPFRVSPPVLSFTLPSGDGPSPAQLISITSDDTGVGWQVGLNTASGGDWLRASTNSGRMPGLVAISADARRLAPGEYIGLVTLRSATGGAVQSLGVAVSLRVVNSDPPRLEPRPTGFSVAVPRGAGRRNLLLEVLNGGAGALAFTASLELLRGAGWVSLPVTSGTTPARLRLTLLPTGLLPGVYRAQIRLRSAEGDAVVPVSLAVSRGQEAVELSRDGVQFQVLAGGPLPPAQTFHVLSIGSTGLNWESASSVDPGLPAWLAVSPSSGLAQPATPSPAQLAVNPSGLAPGRYYGEVLVSAAGAGHSPRLLVVTLDVLDQNTALGPLLLPSGLLFVGPSGGLNPSQQSIQLHNRGKNAFTFSADIVGDSRIWAALLPQDRTVTPGGSARIDITAATAGLAAGIYPATLHIQTSAETTVRSASLQLIVAAGASPTAAVAPPSIGIDCLAGSLRIVPASFTPGFTAVTGLPLAADVLVRDSAGAPMTGGAVNVVLNSGIPGVNRLVHIGGGLWSGNVIAQPQASAPAGMTIAAVDEAGQVGCLEVAGAVQDSQGPVIFEGGVVSPASFLPHTPLSPGGYVGIFGSRLAEGRSEAPSLPLPDTLGFTTVRIAQVGSAPLLFAGEVDAYTQVNGVLPYGLATETIHTLVLTSRLGRTYSPFLVAAAQPSVFTLNRRGFGQAIVVHGANPFLLADPGAAVGIGESIVIYCEGLGAVTPEIVAGSPTPAQPLQQTTLPVTVTIDGKEAQVLFAGLTPGYAGLYQVNAVVPQGVRPGDSVELVVRSGENASAPVTIAVKP